MLYRDIVRTNITAGPIRSIYKAGTLKARLIEKTTKYLREWRFLRKSKKGDQKQPTSQIPTIMDTSENVRKWNTPQQQKLRKAVLVSAIKITHYIRAMHQLVGTNAC